MKWTRSHVVALSAIAGGAGGCGAIWGFEDPIEVASTDAAPESGLDPSPTPGVVCVPPAPEGWQGPLAVFEASAPSPPPLPDCTEKFTRGFDAVAEPKTVGTGCTCSCVPDGDYECGGPLVSFFSDAACTMSCTTPQVAQTEQMKICDPFNVGTCGPTNDYFLKSTAAKPIGKPCKPTVVDPLPPFSLTSEARLCTANLATASGTSCPGGKIAAPAPVLPFNPGNLCIASATAQKCPDGYPAPRTYYDPAKVSDTRKCNDCTCGDLTGVCAGSLTTSDQPDCSGNTVSFKTVPVTTCTLVKKTNDNISYKSDGPPSSVSCATGGGGMTGDVLMGAPLTICCRL